MTPSTEEATSTICDECGAQFESLRDLEVHKVVNDFGDIVCQDPASMKNRFGVNRCVQINGVWVCAPQPANPFEAWTK